jgi:hypothetical protein
MRALCFTAAAWLFALPAAAQIVTVYSEFSRIDPYGKVIRADRGSSEPREILSPAVPRGAFSSFHLVVEGEPGGSYTVQIALNPVDAVKITAFRQRYAKVADEWVPDGLEPVTLPHDGRLASAQIPDQTAQAFWIDMWVERDATVQRIKVEPQVYHGGGWIRYPMEVRVTSPSLGVAGPRGPGLGAGSLGDPSSASAISAWVMSQCNPGEKKGSDSGLSIRNLIARNAEQDVRLAGGSAPPELFRLLGVSSRAGFCRPGSAKLATPEDYLRVRDLLVGARE